MPEITLTVGECDVAGQRFRMPYLEVNGMRLILQGTTAHSLGMVLADRARLCVSTADDHPSRQGVTQVRGECF